MTKQEHWASIKADFMAHVPEQYTVQPIEIDTDSKYYHPTIIIDDDYWIKGQADICQTISSNPVKEYVYGIRLECFYECSCLKYSLGFEIGTYENMKRVLENWTKYKPWIDKYIEVQKVITNNMKLLQDVENKIQSELLQQKFDNDDAIECVNKLLTVKNFIEDERLIERFGV